MKVHSKDKTDMKRILMDIHGCQKMAFIPYTLASCDSAFILAVSPTLVQQLANNNSTFITFFQCWPNLCPILSQQYSPTFRSAYITLFQRWPEVDSPTTMVPTVTDQHCFLKRLTKKYLFFFSSKYAFTFRRIKNCLLY